MKFYNIKDKKEICGFKEAVLRNVGRNGGLFVPLDIPRFDKDFLRTLSRMEFADMSYLVARQIFEKEELPDEELERIVRRAFNFKIEIKELFRNIFVLELFHGPTLSFKDFAARFMAGYMSYIAIRLGQKITVLVATSGDTGSAVANAYHGVEGITVYVLYPSQRVSKLQEKQIATLGGNVTAIEIAGTFDDCQDLVKKALADPYLSKRLSITSANSINVARLIPQIFYYFYCSLMLQEEDSTKIVVSVPCGNFGNLTAGIIAKKMGAPISKFVAATNANKSFPEYLKTGVFKPRKTVKTLANAMDVGNPNNFPRLLEFYDGSVEKMRTDITSFSFTDEEIRSAIAWVYERCKYIMDPHGACGYMGIEEFRKSEGSPEGGNFVFLETAHPGKFEKELSRLLTTEIELPGELKRLVSKKVVLHKMLPRYDVLRDFLISRA